MTTVWPWIQRGYLRLMEPLADWCVRRRISPNTITVVGTLFTILTGMCFALGYIRTGGWVFGLTAVFDVLDGTVARRTGTATRFGAFFDSTLDRVADGAVLGGLLVFYATHPVHADGTMVIISVVGIVATFLTSYTRARAESLGLDAKVGLMQRPERVTLLAAPQAFFGLAWNGRVLDAIVTLLAVTALITVYQRVQFVYQSTRHEAPDAAPSPAAPDGPFSDTVPRVP